MSAFDALARSSAAVAVTFQSPGGNIQKAIDLGRLIRRLGLSTIQFRAVECASACSLAFLGGVLRFAEPGSIGVHKSSFSGDLALNTEDAVSGIQQMTADTITYMIEMGVDPALLQLSLQYDSDDIRYLSKSEMERYRVVTPAPGAAGQQAADQTPSPPASPQAPSPPQVASSSPSPDNPSLAIPAAHSGRIGHRKGSAPIKAQPDGKSASIAVLRNGSAVAILGNSGRWYRVQSGNQVGYMHDTWVHVDQYDSGPFGQFHVQVKSFDNLAEAESYVRSAPVPLSAYLVTNGWFAITLRDTFAEPMAKSLADEMKARGAIPTDAYSTNGNTYVRKVCCNQVP
ncbi:SH3 domain-containing protein [Mesorhizobium sp. INR15]|uniref:SH3 domain-containing protein n=1 Tax=Mesorhizobium sp. INR15 TaxID=2654248 RepID=UPI0018964FD0|nr:SH3 domain-containing protein [Mesorhizobium sp. INR15]QPC89734.1 SH3 domain-containing protein [Mesorhizobium sp. INR15]